MKTPFGNAKINNHGYYYISTGNEYNNQLLHRLLFMKYWRTDIPEGYVIHHKDGNKLNNCTMNLQLVKNEEHSRLHGVNKLGKSMSFNKTGYYRVFKEHDKGYKQGFTYCYEVDDSRLNTKHRKKKKIRRTDLNKLEKEVKRQGYPWKKIEVTNNV